MKVKKIELHIDNLVEDKVVGDDIHEDSNFQDLEEILELTITRKELKFLSNDDRKSVYRVLLHESIDGKLKNGVLSEVASAFQVSKRTVQRIWKRGKTNTPTQSDVSHSRTKNCGRKRVQIDLDNIRNVPLNIRTSIRSLASALNVGTTSLHRFLKEANLRRHSNSIKPFLNEENKRSRLQFCLSMLDESSVPHDPVFKEMYNVVHIDEKWFRITKKNERYYLTPDEEDPHRTCKIQKFIAKVMFLVAIARPRFDEQGREIFSGKNGVFSFVKKEAAKRRSANRAAGTLETKAITSVKRQDVKSFLIKKVLPAIKQKWPREDSSYPIFIQQDNARRHIDHSDEDFCREATEDGFDIRIMCQPENSPDLNVLDLGFFSAIQSLMYQEAPRSVDDLVNAVHKSFED